MSSRVRDDDSSTSSIALVFTPLRRADCKVFKGMLEVMFLTLASVLACTLFVTLLAVLK